MLSVKNRIQAPAKINRAKSFKFDSFVTRSLAHQARLCILTMREEETAANHHHRFRFRLGTNSKRRRLAGRTWRRGYTSAWELEFSKLRGLRLLGSSVGRRRFAWEGRFGVA